MASNNRRGEVRELQNLLLQPKLEAKLSALRQIIAAMTVGKDVSMLFMDIIKNMEVNNLELKKLVYLYVINYSKSQPDLAILGINTFRKDAVDKSNPLIRALAVRTMGSIRIKEVVEYLIDTLKTAIKDEDSYVRKTAVICIAKMHDLSPNVLEEQGFLKLLENGLTDGNAMVVSNTVAAYQSISESKGYNMLQLSSYNVQKLLTALNECNEWGQIYILDALAQYVPSNATEAENILERVASRVSHSNAAVVISTVKIIMKYLDYLTNPDLIRSYAKKSASPMISLLSHEPEIQFVVLKNINIILQKRPNILDKETKMFFCNFNDPIYIKLEKLESLVRLADLKNIDAILHEFKDYATEIDVEFVRKTVRAIGQCAVKLEKAADKCVQLLWELLKGKVPFVVQEAVVVIRDIFRKYPGRYEQILKDICDHLKLLEEPEAKASIIWIIGEYAESIENAEDILSEYAKGFKDEQSIVQLHLLTAYVKLYLTRPQSCEAEIQSLLEVATKECENPDLRDRAFIYWRMLVKNPQMTKTVVLQEKPPISDNMNNLETGLLDKLIENIGTLASIYLKPPEAFIKKMRDSLNQREKEYEEEREQYREPAIEEGAEDSTGQKVGEYEGIARNEYAEAIKNKEIDLLGMDDYDDDKPKKQETTTTASTNMSMNNGEDLLNDASQNTQKSSGGIQRSPNVKNIRIPYSLVMPKTQKSIEETGSGLSVEAAFQRENESVYLYLKVTNESQQAYNGFAMKFNANSFKMFPVNPDLEMPNLDPGDSYEKKVEIGFQGENDNKPPAFPFKIQAGFRTNLGVFVINIPCSLSVFMVPSQTITTQAYSEMASSAKFIREQNKLPTNLENQAIREKMQNNNFNYLGSRKNDAGVELMSFHAKLVNEMPVGCDAILDKTSKNLHLSYFAPHPSIMPLLFQAIGFILNV